MYNNHGSTKLKDYIIQGTFNINGTLWATCVTDIWCDKCVMQF